MSQFLSKNCRFLVVCNHFGFEGGVWFLIAPVLLLLIAVYYGVRKGSKAAVPVHRSFFTGAPVKLIGGPLNITGAPLYFTGTSLYLPVDC